jgi:hypothetical protein
VRSVDERRRSLSSIRKKLKAQLPQVSQSLWAVEEDLSQDLGDRLEPIKA